MGAQEQDTTTTEVTTRPRLVPNLVTGEQLNVTEATTDELAAARDAIKVKEQTELAGYKHDIDRELARRLDRQGKRSATVGPWKITVPAPTKTVWDGEAAFAAITQLIKDDVLDKDVRARCVTPVTTYKAQHGELVKLLKHTDQRVRDAIAACQTEVDVTSRSASVTPVAGAKLPAAPEAIDTTATEVDPLTGTEAQQGGTDV